MLTNRFNADEAIVAAVANDSYHGGGDISITGLNRPPQMRVLEKRHASKLTEDVSDRLASLKGQIGHGILERAGLKNEWSEKRIGVNILGWEVTGQPDKFEAMGLKDGVLIDFKLPTLSSFLFGFQRDKGLKPEWITQGNSYRFLLAKHGINVTKIVFKAVLTEWSKRHARVKTGYPDRPFFNFEVPVWTLEQTGAWITERVRIHQDAEKLPDSTLPPCSDEERWAQPSKFVVKKEGRKNAIPNSGRAIKAEADALAFELGKGHYVEPRPGEFVRCNDYCKVKAFCHQLKQENPEGVDASMI